VADYVVIRKKKEDYWVCIGDGQIEKKIFSGCLSHCRTIFRAFRMCDVPERTEYVLSGPEGVIAYTMIGGFFPVKDMTWAHVFTSEKDAEHVREELKLPMNEWYVIRHDHIE
jgi:hypothetical protein